MTWRRHDPLEFHAIGTLAPQSPFRIIQRIATALLRPGIDYVGDTCCKGTVSEEGEINPPWSLNSPVVGVAGLVFRRTWGVMGCWVGEG